MATPLMTIAIVVMFIATTPMGIVVVLAQVRQGYACDSYHCQVSGQGRLCGCNIKVLCI